jgi:hypothetical protein
MKDIEEQTRDELFENLDKILYNEFGNYGFSTYDYQEIIKELKKRIK